MGAMSVGGRGWGAGGVHYAQTTLRRVSWGCVATVELEAGPDDS